MAAPKTELKTKAKPKRKRSLVFTLLTILCGVFFALLAAAWATLAFMLRDESLVSSLALQPAVGSLHYDLTLPGRIERRSVFVPARDGSRLHAWIFTVPGATRVALVNHGNAGNNAGRLYLASALTKAGLNVVLYDYRGYGISTGKPSIKGILEDGDTMFEYVNQKLGYSPQQIILYGESIGTAVTCHVASRHNCQGVVLQSPIASLPAAAKFVIHVLRAYPDFFFAEPRLNNLQLVGAIRSPVLLMHGLKDTIVSPDSSRALYAAANEPKTLVYLPGCGHNDMGVQDSQLFNESIGKFILSLTKPGALQSSSGLQTEK